MSSIRMWLLAIWITACFGRVLSSLYPTQPIANTVFTFGQPAMITWLDDKHKPHLNNMGPIKIDLHGNRHDKNNTYLATLAIGVEPTTCAHSVFIPPDLSRDTTYTLRFICTKPHLTIYTADFNITAPSNFFPVNAAATSTPSTLLLGSTTQADSATTVHANPLGTDTSVTSPGIYHKSSETKKSGSNSRTIQFRSLSILWPTLIGISMTI